MKKDFLIIGLGQLGKHLVSTLNNAGANIMVIDNDRSRLEEIEGLAVQAICADASRPEVLSQIDVESFDGAIVTMGDNLEGSVRTIMHLSEMGAPFIMAKATTDFEGRIYRKVGADKVIFPEREVGIRLAKELAYGNYYDAINLSDEYSITDIIVPVSEVGKSLAQMRKEHHLNPIGIRRLGDFIINPDPETQIEDEDVLVVLATIKEIEAVRSKWSKK